MKDFTVSVLKDSYGILAALFRILVPMIILIKILEMTGLVAVLGRILEPVMVLVGVPGAMGLAWASALMTNLYGGVIAFSSLSREIHVTTAQATTLAAMMLMAHAIPVEVQIAKKAGTRFIAMSIFRIGSAMIFGMILNLIYKTTGALNTQAVVIWSQKSVDNSLAGWAVGELKSLVWIACIVTLLVVLMRILKKIGVIDIINKACGPLLKVMGIGSEASYVTMVGFTLGVTYGGGLIIKEAQSGAMSHRDVFFSLAFMGICHSMIEDTILMMAIGGHLSGILWMRTVFAVLIVAAAVRLSSLMPDRYFYRYLFVNRGAESLS